MVLACHSKTSEDMIIDYQIQISKESNAELVKGQCLFNHLCCCMKIFVKKCTLKQGGAQSFLLHL